MGVNRKRGPEKMEKTTDGKEVHEKRKTTPLVSQSKASKQKVGNDQKKQALLELMKNINGAKWWKKRVDSKGKSKEEKYTRKEGSLEKISTEKNIVVPSYIWHGRATLTREARTTRAKGAHGHASHAGSENMFLCFRA
jgi:hypothetical protein